MTHTCSAPTWAAGSPVQYQCRSAPPAPQPRRSYSVTVVLRISVPSGRATHSWLRRIGSCQQTSGFIVSGCHAQLQRFGVQRTALPGVKPGPVQEDAGALVFAGAKLRFALVLVEFEITLAAQALVAELPVLVGELGHGVVQPGAVVVVGQKRPVRTTSVVGTVRRRCPDRPACRTHRSSGTAARSGPQRSDARDCPGRRTPPIRGRSPVRLHRDVFGCDLPQFSR